MYNPSLIFMSLLVLIVITTYISVHFIEMSSFGTRVAGRITNRAALGTTLSQTIYTLSRLILIIFLPSLAYLVESGITINDYLLLILCTYILTFIVSVTMITKINSLQKFYQVVFENYANNTIPIAILKSIVSKKTNPNQKTCDKFTFDKIILKKTLLSFLAYTFLITGFFNAFLLAIMFPENRLTISQFVATFHGFGAVIFAFYLDPMLSRSIDSYSDDVSWLQNVYSIFLGRVLSYLAMIILLSVFLFAI